MTEAMGAQREASPGGPPAARADGDADLGAALRLARTLADRLAEVRSPQVHSLRLARGMVLSVVDVLEGLQADRRP